MMKQENLPEKKAIEITQLLPETLEKYGTLYNMTQNGGDTHNVSFSAGDGWSGADTTRPLIDTIGAFGYTNGSGTPFVCREMERHLHTEEAQIPLQEPICFCMALSGTEEPAQEDVIPVILRPGYIFVLHRGTWHSASHGIGRDSHYYWMAWVYRNEPTVWRTLKGGPIVVTAEGG